MFRKRLIVISIIGLFGIVALVGSVAGSIPKLDATQFINFSKKNPPVPKEIDKESNKKLKFLNKGKDVSCNFSKQVLIDIPYGTKEEELGFREYNEEPPGWTIAPGAIDVSRNGDIYIGDPANGEVGMVADFSPFAENPVIKVFSKNGKYLRKIPITEDWRGDFGLDAKDNLYILSPTRVFKKEAHKDSFEAVGPALNEGWMLEVEPSGNFNTIDTSPPPDDNIRGQKFDSKGKLLKKAEQHNFDHNLFEFEDEEGYKVNFQHLGGGLGGVQYLVSMNKPQKEEIIYEPYLPDGYYYEDGKVIGFDVKGRMYWLNIIMPDIPVDNEQDALEKESKMEVGVDVIDLKQGEISSVRLEPDKQLYGDFVTHHFYTVDTKGNIYQLQVDKQRARVWKYSWK